MTQRIFIFFLLVYILSSFQNIKSQEVAPSAKNPISLELYFVLPSENYFQSTFGEIDYSMIVDLVNDPENMTKYPFTDYTDNLISETKSPYGFELDGSLVPKFPGWRSGVFYPEIKFGIGFYRNNFSHFGHYENTPLMGDTIQKDYIYYLHYFDYIVASGDFIIHYKVLKWLNVYAGLGIMAGVSIHSKIDETISSYKYIQNDDFVNRFDASDSKNTYPGKQLVKLGFSIPIGLRFALYKKIALRLEYDGGRFYEFVINGETYPKKTNNFALGIQYRFRN